MHTSESRLNYSYEIVLLKEKCEMCACLETCISYFLLIACFTTHACAQYSDNISSVHIIWPKLQWGDIDHLKLLAFMVNASGLLLQYYMVIMWLWCGCVVVELCLWCGCVVLLCGCVVVMICVMMWLYLCYDVVVFVLWCGCVVAMM